MIVDIIDKLVDRSLQLLSRHKQSKRKLYENPIKDIFEQFELVHENYTRRYAKYRTLIQECDMSPSQFEAILDKIKIDGLLSSSTRTKVEVACNNRK